MAKAATAVQRIRQLDKERGALVAAARKEALGRARDAVADLVALGFKYDLVEGGRKVAVPAVKAGRRGARGIKDAPCPVCSFQTSPPHDARRHRAQGKRKTPFTPAQLEAFGLKKV
ncbi:MAG: hypothetical protein IPK81_13975 [Rhodospirillales bacterium]|nr:MAG: hypothetical protein IPK81_13975 [Rhodospirillales bacterium]